MQDGLRQARRQIFSERRPTSSHLVQHNSSSPDVRTRIRFLTEQLFRRHVGKRAEDGLRLSQ